MRMKPNKLINLLGFPFSPQDWSFFGALQHHLPEKKRHNIGLDFKSADSPLLSLFALFASVYHLCSYGFILCLLSCVSLILLYLHCPAACGTVRTEKMSLDHVWHALGDTQVLIPPVLCVFVEQISFTVASLRGLSVNERALGVILDFTDEMASFLLENKKHFGFFHTSFLQLHFITADSPRSDPHPSSAFISAANVFF
ncbi:hypothetical protein CRENBAI_024836 [Crenichthys baileyi]|uniref:Uncharacterized protein n=1 Tax=Crenichthys baileyi TaxID=28760 RepID=A0AAV9S2Q8_9TELE